MIDFELQRCTRKCHATQRELRAGETIVSAIVRSGADVVRQDYSLEGWTGPPENCLGHWKSVVTEAVTKRVQWAPNDMMISYLEQLEQDPSREDVRYLLALLLVRRRIARVERSEKDESGTEFVMLYCPRNEVEYRVKVAFPSGQRVIAIQQELGQLLQAPAAA